MPFFTCINVLFEKEAHIDIEKYLYCKEFGVAPYPGSFNDQPKRWVDRVFFIKKALAKKEKSMIDKQNKEAKNG